MSVEITRLKRQLSEQAEDRGGRAKATRKFSPVSYCEHGLPISENLLNQDFSASGPN